MAHSQEVFRKAEEILERRREKANIEADLRNAEIKEKIPELESISSKLSQIGLSISKVFLFSKDKKADIDGLMAESLKLQEERKKLLVEKGYDENALDVIYTCPTCKDTGMVSGRRCTCYKELLKSIERASVEKIVSLDDYTFDSFKVEYYPDDEREGGISPRKKAEKIMDSCRRYAISFTTKSNNVMFMGGTGLGKTHLSLAIANVVLNRGYSVIYGTSQNILNDLQNENFGRTDNIRYNEKDVLNCDLLIIDDLGTEFKSNYTVACLYNIINSRICAKLPTIISTNFTDEELEEKYDQRIFSRITGAYSRLVLEGNDIRYIKK